jgi:mRNA interferase RelE/StbE
VKVLVSEVARADVRRIGQTEAIRILRSIAEFARTGRGDVKALVGGHAGKYRLRVGDYRVIFRTDPQQAMLVLRVLHRNRAY